MRNLLAGHTKLAIAPASRGQPEDAQEIHEFLNQAHASAVALRIPEADQIAKLYSDICGKPLL